MWCFWCHLRPLQWDLKQKVPSNPKSNFLFFQKIIKTNAFQKKFWFKTIYVFTCAKHFTKNKGKKEISDGFTYRTVKTRKRMIYLTHFSQLR